MEKLIELLNEYDVGVVSREKREYSEITGDMIRGISDDQERLSMADICSKKFGFIQWLVENEKIDGEKFQEPKIRGTIGLISNWHNSEGKSYKDYSKELAYESLLMHLAIQDEPIEFLIGILK